MWAYRHGEDEIEALFGFRYNGTKPQSWCHNYRSSANRCGEKLDVYDAAEIWMSNGMDEDYTFGFSESELRNAL